MNSEINLSAEIIPSISCGVIKIGSHLSNCLFLENASWVSVINNPDVDLDKSTGWTCQNIISQDRNSIIETTCYYRNNIIMIAFNSKGILYFILLKNDYSGKVFNKIGIGSTLGDLKKIIEFEYDSGDEAYYPSDKSGIKGIAFYTGNSPSAQPEEEDLFVLEGGNVDSLDDDDEIIMISVQDWIFQD